MNARHHNSVETYYDLPAVKPTPFGWHVGVYLFISALCGAAQIIAAIAGRAGGGRMRPVARNGRYIAFAGSVAGPLLLMADLKTPRRWYNMLRIFRRTSPMSIGSYTLSAFAATSAATALGEALGEGGELPVAACVAEAPAVAAAAGMLTYTGALLSSTSTPLWAAQSPLLAARFASSGIASGAAALALAEALGGRMRNASTLELLALTAAATETVLTHRAEEKVREAQVHVPYGTLKKAGDALLFAAPIACRVLALATGRRSRALSIASALSTLAGAALLRFAEFEGGKQSAQRAGDYLRYASGDSR
jgi:hypothetical protein